MRRLAVVVALTVASALLMSCSGGRYTVTAVFDDVGDLQRLGSVQVADVRVGRISRIELTEDFRAKVSLAIDDGRRIPRQSVAYVRTTSLLGEKFVELRPVGDPAAGPYLGDGDAIAKTAEAPELEFVAGQAIEVLGGVVGADVASIVRTGAEGFGGRGPELRSLIEDLATMSSGLAARTDEIQRIITNLDQATSTLAGGAPALDQLLVRFAETSKVLSDNRDRTLAALQQLNRLAAAGGPVLHAYYDEIDQQVKQVDAIVAAVATRTGEIDALLSWLNRFVLGVPKVIPGEFTQIYMWVVPAALDPRAGTP